MKTFAGMIFCLMPGTLLLATGCYLLQTGHSDAGGGCIVFGILALGSVSYNSRGGSL